MNDSPGASIGPYRIVRRLGGGEASDVLLATRVFPGGFERRVVIKRLRAADHDALATEAVAYARMAHPAIVQLFDFFVSGEELALVLEYVDGLSLARLLQSLRARGERLSDRASMFVMSRVFAALAAAHSARDPVSGEVTPVIHRDVNPSNVLVPWDGFVKIGDFDLAKVVGVSSETRSGLLKGTYGYMAPEQVLGEPVTPKTDVYGACLVLRELLIGRAAFDSTMPELELLRAMDDANHAPIEALRSGVSPRLASAMTRGLARDVTARTLTAAEMVEVLRSEVDTEAGHAELIAACARVRAHGERGTDRQRANTPTARPVFDPNSVDHADPPTPRGVTLGPRESLPPTGASLAPTAGPTRDRRTHVASAAVVALCFVLGGAYVAAVTRATSPEAIDARAPLSLAHAPDAMPAAAAPEARDLRDAHDAAPVDTMGAIVTPPSAHAHRVFLDGRVASYTSGVTLRVACGTHTVRIGSSGATQLVDVPCGGSVTIAPL